ncbi:hypothetical protein [Allofournierella massiliensis]|uniref:Uncharacterized protein n=1 Tax=Allofournierella massiliensis TaxID=1650663 RepID=A0ABT7UN02_9FIRM|nr:hypothetical protein [Fournierella massiliensis]MDM8200280.1 hypothetical protein [Fournierella massiliensis]
MRTFYVPVDLRSRAEMTGFLKKHFRYYTMNSWNRSTSYACNLKIHRLGLDGECESKLYDMLDTQEFSYLQHSLLQEFARQYNYRWQAGMNGRSSGYLVLYQGELQPSGYLSFCTVCGQKNYRAASETDCVCGVCQNPTRINFDKPDMLVTTYPGRGTDMDEDYEDWSLSDLRERVRIVQALDQLADNMVSKAIQLCRSYHVAEETIYVPQVRKVLVEST